MVTDVPRTDSFDSLFIEERADLYRLDVYPAAAPAWTKLIEDLHLRSMKGETSVNGIRWQHRQTPIIVDDKAVMTTSYRRWERTDIV